ncbi:hypothetical protein C1H46_036871 [Malus baccata]|uniref:SGNH hydrolase-type esterase domain-containing protein n=1 Tax=Malus baccata TaxID=106549 RepID=A0A540KTZ1_MALBA|nr:hypothetical protein C1H46_036871 [Malus baccata]
MASSSLYIQISAFALFTSLLDITTQASHGECGIPNKHTPAVPLFVFGDSIFDAGNNNYFSTVFQGNYWPYGETYKKGHPTGRISDGRIIPDFIAEYAKLPSIPPYLEPGNEEFKYGVNFASAGAGALIETRQGLGRDLHCQLSYFKNVGKSLRQKLGDEEAKSLLTRAVYLSNIGSNDYLFPFDTDSSMLRSYSREEFVGLVIGNITSVIKEIYNEGGRNFGFMNLYPLACIPYGRALGAGPNNGCHEELATYVELHNKAFYKHLEKLESELKGFRYSLTDFHKFITQRIDHPSEYGFKEGKVACCGSGPYRGVYSCGGRRGVKEYDLCDNVSEHLFFDSAHPTEMAYEQSAKLFWSGTPDFTAPYNLKALFESNQDLSKDSSTEIFVDEAIHSEF